MKTRYISFDFGKTRGPNVTSNPLPNHLALKINALTEDLAESENPSRLYKDTNGGYT